MGLFDLFRRKNQETNPEPVIDPNGNSPATGIQASGQYDTNLPIDMIYNFLKEDFEGKAYRDALTNPDKSYKEKNMAIIRSNLEVKFKQVMLKYEDMLRDIDFHIQSREQAGLIDLVEMLKSKKITYQKHVEEIIRMKEDLDKEELYMTGVFKSYEVGFTRGLASISLQNLKLDDTL